MEAGYERCATAASSGVISFLYYATTARYFIVHEIVQRVYYLPIVIAAPCDRGGIPPRGSAPGTGENTCAPDPFSETLARDLMLARVAEESADCFHLRQGCFAYVLTSTGTPVLVITTIGASSPLRPAWENGPCFVFSKIETRGVDPGYGKCWENRG